MRTIWAIYRADLPPGAPLIALVIFGPVVDPSVHVVQRPRRLDPFGSLRAFRCVAVEHGCGIQVDLVPLHQHRRPDRLLLRTINSTG